MKGIIYTKNIKRLEDVEDLKKILEKDYDKITKKEKKSKEKFTEKIFSSSEEKRKEFYLNYRLDGISKTFEQGSNNIVYLYGAVTEEMIGFIEAAGVTTPKMREVIIGTFYLEEQYKEKYLNKIVDKMTFDFEKTMEPDTINFTITAEEEDLMDCLLENGYEPVMYNGEKTINMIKSCREIGENIERKHRWNFINK